MDYLFEEEQRERDDAERKAQDDYVCDVNLNKEYRVAQDGFENNQDPDWNNAQWQTGNAMHFHSSSQPDEDKFAEENRVERKMAEHANNTLRKRKADEAKRTEEQHQARLAKEFKLRKQQREKEERKEAAKEQRRLHHGTKETTASATHQPHTAAQSPSPIRASSTTLNLFRAETAATLTQEAPDEPESIEQNQEGLKENTSDSSESEDSKSEDSEDSESEDSEDSESEDSEPEAATDAVALSGPKEDAALDQVDGNTSMNVTNAMAMNQQELPDELDEMQQEKMDGQTNNEEHDNDDQVDYENEPGRVPGDHS
jgi:translation initiation factor 5B